MSLIRLILRRLYRDAKLVYAIIRLRRQGCTIEWPLRCDPAMLLDSTRFKAGFGVRIGKNAHLSIVENGKLTLGDRVVIGSDFIVSCAGTLTIHSDVLFADRCYVADSYHEYRSVNHPVIEQGMICGETIIGKGCWFGVNTVVAKACRIGEHSIIGANSVVCSDLEGHAVYVGSPARAVKKFDKTSMEWRKCKI